MAIVVWIDDECDVVWREGIPTRDDDWDEFLADRTRADHLLPRTANPRWGYWMVLK